MAENSHSLQEITDSLVASPQFQATIAKMIQRSGNVGAASTPMATFNFAGPSNTFAAARPTMIQPASTRPTMIQPTSTRPTAPAATAQQELSSLFNCGQRNNTLTTLARPPFATFRSSSPAFPVPTRQRRGLGRMRSSASEPSTSKPPFVLKEVVLLDKASCRNILRAKAKASLMDKG